MEKVRSKLPEMFETNNFLMSEIEKNAEVEKVSTRDYRIPILVSNGGDYRTFSPDGGDMGLGSGPLTKHYVTTYFSTALAVQLSNLQMYATASSEQAVKKAFSLALANAMKEFQANEDASLHVSGGVIGQATAHAHTGSVTNYTLDTVMGTQFLRRQAPVKLYDTTLGTDLTAAVAVADRRIATVNHVSNTITLTSDVSGTANTDKILFDGVTGATPTWKKGIPDFLSTAVTGNLMSLSRSDNPEIIANFISVGGPLAALHGMRLLDAIDMRRDEVPDLMVVMHPKQRTNWYNEGIAISEWQRGKSDSMLDIAPKRTREFQYCGLRAVVDKHQQRDRIEFLAKKKWGRAVLKDVDWYTVGDKKIFEMRGASTGVAAGILMYMECHSDWYTDDVGSQGFLYGITI